MTVFSAQAEVFPNPPEAVNSPGSFLRASGGVSFSSEDVRRFASFSPRKRRCFLKKLGFDVSGLVFSAQAEVFPTRLIV